MSTGLDTRSPSQVLILPLHPHGDALPEALVRPDLVAESQVAVDLVGELRRLSDRPLAEVLLLQRPVKRLSFNGISRIVGGSPGALRVRVHRILQQVRGSPVITGRTRGQSRLESGRPAGTSAPSSQSQVPLTSSRSRISLRERAWNRCASARSSGRGIRAASVSCGLTSQRSVTYPATSSAMAAAWSISRS